MNRVLLLLLSGLVACSRVHDEQIEPETVPEAMIIKVGERLPDATGVSFKPLIARKVWFANAYASSAMNTLFVSRTEILEHYRVIVYLRNDDIRNLVSQSSFGAGLMNITWASELSPPEAPRYQVEFSLWGKRYLLATKEQRGSSVSYELFLYPRALNHLETNNYEDLPNEIKALFSAKEFKKALITEEGNRIFYQITLNEGVIEIDDELRIFYSSAGGNRTTITLEELPAPAREWLNENPASEKLSEVVCERFSFNGTEGYRVVFSDKNEKKYVHFDKFGKNLYHYYSLTAVL